MLKTLTWRFKQVKFCITHLPCHPTENSKGCYDRYDQAVRTAWCLQWTGDRVIWTAWCLQRMGDPSHWNSLMFLTNGQLSCSNRFMFQQPAWCFLQTGDQAVWMVDKQLVNGKLFENGKPLEYVFLCKVTNVNWKVGFSLKAFNKYVQSSWLHPPTTLSVNFWLGLFFFSDDKLVIQGSKLRLIRSPMRLTFSPWRLKILV